ncbi:hypothetical protein BDR07DRAFT_1478614 [Suillus spraguei]|nr:hypothetical protein BDR07DRAFT_1478614 [Suillus spraguei]
MSHSRSRSSPKKKRLKCKAVDSDRQVNSTKKLQAGANMFPISMCQSLWTTPRPLDILGVQVQEEEKPPPPPYSPSETVDPPSSRKQGKKDKAMKKGIAPASTSSCEVPNLQPSFSHRKPGSQFGFKQSLIPPGTDVHLQVNNTLIAATKKPSDPTAHPPAPIYPMPTAPTTSTSVMHQTDATFYKNLNPALQSTTDVCLESRGTDSESSDSETTDDGDESDDDDKDSSSSDDDNDGQDAHGDQEVGWGAAYGHHSAHPSFSKEAQPSQPLVTTALPTDFEFQHSHDEDDNAAMKSLVADVTSSTDNASTPAETKDLKSKSKAKPKSKASCEGLKATQLGWYGPRWKSFLEEPIPEFVDDLPGSVNETLMSSLVEWLEGECAAWVEEAATTLLEDSAFLHYGVDELGKTQNAAHPALREAVIAFFYTGSYRVARRRPDIFQKQLPLECLALVCTAVNCVLDGLKRNGNSKSIPKFTSKEYGTLYDLMFKLLR